MWTGRQIALLWSVAVVLLAVTWGVAHFTDVFPATSAAFAILWVLASAGPAVATWQWVRVGRPAGDDPAQEEEDGSGSREEV